MIETDSDLEDFEEFYDAPLEFMDSFENSVQISTEVSLNGDSIELKERKNNADDMNAPGLENAILENGLDARVGHVTFAELSKGDFGEINTGLANLQLQKKKFR